MRATGDGRRQRQQRAGDVSPRMGAGVRGQTGCCAWGVGALRNICHWVEGGCGGRFPMGRVAGWPAPQAVVSGQ